jgi:hypothetical protein
MIAIEIRIPRGPRERKLRSFPGYGIEETG